MTKERKLGKGDKVTWSSHGSKVPGTIKKKITSRMRAGGRTVDASPDDPQYEVESEKSGRRAVHKPQSLRKKGGG
ncbi:hypothetical protein GCM10018793_07700 [Streptomyces sulfonofaciens]|uniref:Hypervirulence associated protein TUDOR domain-containing protein n=1 Tax=Streptomyces sulfonofaciens TaxID=68272 RepID=A0A919FTG8_9ACTN|nr:DUF2945 domain-containing protein [Streptomyces sulfonofaciens]GHH71763.1 hypothetical protein GCM10018793_07700 [Streptomyces sulfonofaciens]